MTPLQHIFAHPIDKHPYNLLYYSHTDGNDCHIYDVYDTDGNVRMQAGALNALRQANRLAPTSCWYCNDGLVPAEVHRDHVEPRAKNGENDLHNILISCPDHNTRKADHSIAAFNEDGATRYLTAMHRHLHEISKIFAIRKST